MSEFESGIKAIRKSMKKAAEDAKYLESSADFKDVQKDITEMSINIVQELEKMDTEAGQMEATILAMIQQYKDDDDLELPKTDAEFEELYKKAADAHKNVTGDTEFFQDIISSMQEKTEEATVDQSQDGMQVMQVQINKKDPISKKDIVTPVIYEPCGHVYDRDSIQEFAGKKRQIKCAMQGCSETITISRLIDYPDYWKHIKPPQ